jgi:palmitoyltransferase
MFMAYLCLSSTCFVVLGYNHVLDALGVNWPVCRWQLYSLPYQNSFLFQVKWPYHIPQVIFILFYILAAVMAFAVGVMCAYHVWTVSSGETTVEAQDHEVYRNMATSRGEV